MVSLSSRPKLMSDPATTLARPSGFMTSCRFAGRDTAVVRPPRTPGGTAPISRAGRADCRKGRDKRPLDMLFLWHYVIKITYAEVLRIPRRPDPPRAPDHGHPVSPRARHGQ